MGLPRKLKPAEVQALLDAGKTPRVRELEFLQSVFDGSQYAGRPDFYNDDVPLRERAPCVVSRLAAIGVESNVAFAMGEGRFPVISALSSEDDTAFDDTLGLSKDESAVLDSFNAKLVDLARLEQVFRNAYRMAQASRSVAIVLGFRAGLPFADLVWSKLCVPTFGDPQNPTKCTRLEIRYRYTEQWRDPVVTGGEWWTRVFEYLRVIDDKTDTVYRPVAVWDPTDDGVTKGSPVAQLVPHGFGLCPVHWYARNRASVVGGAADGIALADGTTGLLEQLDLGLSQRHRAAVYAGDPQTVVSGVTEDDTFAGSGRAASGPMLQGEGGAGDPTKAGREWGPSLQGNRPGSPRLRRGVGQVWRITDPQGKAVLLTLPGDALTSLDNDAKDLANRACDALGVTVLDPSAFGGGGDLSGRTLSFIFSKQINRVSQDREDLARCCILPVLNLFYQMVLTQPKGVYLPGLAKVAPILARFRMAVDGQAPVWFSPQLKLKWGDYFEPSDVDESTRTQTAINAYNAKLVTLKSAVQHIGSVFQIGSVDQYVETLSKEADDRAAKDLAAKADALHGALGAMNGAPKSAVIPGAAKPPLPKRSAGASAKPQ